jgi:hypothetical protein
MAAVEPDLIADAAITSGEWRQYVPLATCSLVLLDIALGRPVANSFAAALFKGEAVLLVVIPFGPNDTHSHS